MEMCQSTVKKKSNNTGGRVHITDTNEMARPHRLSRSRRLGLRRRPRAVVVGGAGADERGTGLSLGDDLLQGRQ